MIESADYLTHKHFGKLLADPGVEILDPATGTGTFITELIEYLPANKLEYKYKNEIHCNEVAILPYYVANLNIELTYKQKMGKYEEFQNICFVDTLEHTTLKEKQGSLFSMSVENTRRIREQNDRTISIVIGNPPYNSNQQSENDQNKNRPYPAIDKRIKDNYIQQSNAQKTKLYDMYSRFFRWASDRLGKDGILVFITNSSFVNMKTFDGFRKVVAQEFDEIYIIDLGGDVRANPKLSGSKHNIFGIQTGVAISFMIKKSIESKYQNSLCKVFYHSRPEFETSKEKINFISNTRLVDIDFKHSSGGGAEWIDIADNDFETLLPLVSKERKIFKEDDVETIFKFCSMGAATNRDDWVYDFSRDNLEVKMCFFIEKYNLNMAKVLEKPGEDLKETLDYSIKWSETLVSNLKGHKKGNFDKGKIVTSFYRPFSFKFYYADPLFSDRLTSYHSSFFGSEYNEKNKLVGMIGISTEIPFSVLGFETVNDLNSLSPAAGGNKSIPLYFRNKDGACVDNITRWGLNQFRDHYKKHLIQPEDIFHYVYAVLHHPAYRTKYELNLKREFPRIPFYANFQQWADWGKQLMDLHINFEEAEPYALERIGEGMADESHLAMQASLFGDETTNGHSHPTKKAAPKCKLKADKIAGTIELDTVTTLKGIPAIAWEYKLGNRSALEWILDQYKEKKPKDPTIAKLFNTYKFADYKEHVIELLQRVCTVSVETMAIVQQMPTTVEHEK